MFNESRRDQYRMNQIISKQLSIELYGTNQCSLSQLCQQFAFFAQDNEGDFQVKLLLNYINNILSKRNTWGPEALAMNAILTPSQIQQQKAMSPAIVPSESTVQNSLTIYTTGNDICGLVQIIKEYIMLKCEDSTEMVGVACAFDGTAIRKALQYDLHSETLHGLSTKVSFKTLADLQNALKDHKKYCTQLVMACFQPLILSKYREILPPLIVGIQSVEGGYTTAQTQEFFNSIQEEAKQHNIEIIGNSIDNYAAHREFISNSLLTVNENHFPFPIPIFKARWHPCITVHKQDNHHLIRSLFNNAINPRRLLPLGEDNLPFMINATIGAGKGVYSYSLPASFSKLMDKQNERRARYLSNPAIIECIKQNPRTTTSTEYLTAISEFALSSTTKHMDHYRRVRLQCRSCFFLIHSYVYTKEVYSDVKDDTKYGITHETMIALIQHLIAMIALIAVHKAKKLPLYIYLISENICEHLFSLLRALVVNKSSITAMEFMHNINILVSRQMKLAEANGKAKNPLSLEYIELMKVLPTDRELHMIWLEEEVAMKKKFCEVYRIDSKHIKPLHEAINYICDGYTQAIQAFCLQQFSHDDFLDLHEREKLLQERASKFESMDYDRLKSKNSKESIHEYEKKFYIETNEGFIHKATIVANCIDDSQKDAVSKDRQARFVEAQKSQSIVVRNDYLNHIMTTSTVISVPISQADQLITRTDIDPNQVIQLLPDTLEVENSETTTSNSQNQLILNTKRKHVVNERGQEARQLFLEPTLSMYNVIAFEELQFCFIVVNQTLYCCRIEQIRKMSTSKRIFTNHEPTPKKATEKRQFTLQDIVTESDMDNTQFIATFFRIVSRNRLLMLESVPMKWRYYSARSAIQYSIGTMNQQYHVATSDQLILTNVTTSTLNNICKQIKGKPKCVWNK